jgi:hypothetical protein
VAFSCMTGSALRLIEATDTCSFQSWICHYFANLFQSDFHIDRGGFSK